MLAGVGPPLPHPSSCTYKNQTWETEMKDEVLQIREGCSQAGACCLAHTHTGARGNVPNHSLALGWELGPQTQPRSP